jgi:hypothetical protein
MSEQIPSVILEASITSAGLLIAIYALITPLSSKIFETRVKPLKQKRREFIDLMAKISPEGSEDDIDKLRSLSGEIGEIGTFPSYLGQSVIFDFVLFMVTAIFAFFSLIDPSVIGWQISCEILFGISMLGFLSVGVYAIVDVFRSMRSEFENVKKQMGEYEIMQRNMTERFRKYVDEAAKSDQIKRQRRPKRDDNENSD